jgi:hypothetical protein
VQPELAAAVQDAARGQSALVKMELYERALGGDVRAMTSYLEHA